MTMTGLSKCLQHSLVCVDNPTSLLSANVFQRLLVCSQVLGIQRERVGMDITLSYVQLHDIRLKKTNVLSQSSPGFQKRMRNAGFFFSILRLVEIAVIPYNLFV